MLSSTAVVPLSFIDWLQLMGVLQGPAYFYLIMEAMIDAGVHLGLPRSVPDCLLSCRLLACLAACLACLACLHSSHPARNMAKQLVVETLFGTVTLARETDKHPALLRESITSPGT